MEPFKAKGRCERKAKLNMGRAPRVALVAIFSITPRTVSLCFVYFSAIFPKWQRLPDWVSQAETGEEEVRPGHAGDQGSQGAPGRAEGGGSTPREGGGRNGKIGITTFVFMVRNEDLTGCFPTGVKPTKIVELQYS